MSSIQEVLRRIDTVTFDCYGTLIDWRAGVGGAFAALFEAMPGGRLEDLFEAYVQAEAEMEAAEYQSYRKVLIRTAEQLATKFGLDLPTERAGLLAQLLPQWQPFPDTNEALTRLKRRYRLGVLSNIDRDLFAATARRFDVAFDFVVTAEDVRAYKPADGHFERMLAEHADRDRVLHVAQSLFHDGVPCARLGIAYVWINRYNDLNETAVRPLAAYRNLASLAEAADEK